MATAAAADNLLTAEQFGRMPDPGYPEELVQGQDCRDAATDDRVTVRSAAKSITLSRIAMPTNTTLATS